MTSQHQQAEQSQSEQDMMRGYYVPSKLLLRPRQGRSVRVMMSHIDKFEEIEEADDESLVLCVVYCFRSVQGVVKSL